MKLGLIDWIIIGAGILAVAIFTTIEVIKFKKEKKEKDAERIEKAKGNVVAEIEDDEE